MEPYPSAKTCCTAELGRLSQLGNANVFGQLLHAFGLLDCLHEVWGTGLSLGARLREDKAPVQRRNPHAIWGLFSSLMFLPKNTSSIAQRQCFMRKSRCMHFHILHLKASY